jgi:hypothetical protein
MTSIVDDLLATLKNSGAGRHPDPASTRGRRPEEPEKESSGPLHRISEACFTGDAIVGTPADAVKPSRYLTALQTPECESPATGHRQVELDALTGTFSTSQPDSDDVEAEHEARMVHLEKRGLLGLTETQILEPDGEVWEIAPLSPARRRLLAKSKRAANKRPIERLADVTAPADAEPVEADRTPGADHPWRREFKTEAAMSAAGGR